MTKTYASDLGKCYNQTADGYYRLYKVDGCWAIYIVMKEFSWSEKAQDFVYGTRLEATFGGYLSDPANFEFGVDELKAEVFYY